MYYGIMHVLWYYTRSLSEADRATFGALNGSHVQAKLFNNLQVGFVITATAD